MVSREIPSMIWIFGRRCLEVVSCQASVGGIELHAWNAAASDLAHSDRVKFDLDPDPSLPWNAMLEAAMLLKVVFDGFGLISFPKQAEEVGFTSS